ncbi:MAG: hypothetical protein JW901_04555 [Dehalococcoidia bacterium]|nr:hypothetical protein [Dehalococcoidia bacterium]
MKYIDTTTRLLPLLLLIFAASCVSKEYPVTDTVTETRYRTEYVTEVYTENETTIDTVTNSYELPLYYSWYSQNIAFNGQTNFWYLAYDIPQWPVYDNLRLTISIWKQFQYESASIRILDMTGSDHLTTPAPATYGDTDVGQVEWTWITPSTTATASASSSSSSGTAENPSEESSVTTTGGAATTWLDKANVQINEAKFLGGRTNLWSRPEDPQVFELDASKAQKIGVIICGPQNQWNARVTVKGAFTRNIVSYKTVSGERQVAKQVPYEVQKQQTIYQVRQVPFWEAFSH